MEREIYCYFASDNNLFLDMTAIVGVLNKHTVAIAADSAVTMGDTHKVVNCANKIFTISKYHPVAVMTYNNASFMGVPWDIIIKEYRRNLKDGSFPKLEGYVTDFISFLHDRHFFCDCKTQLNYLKIILNSFYSICCSEICVEKNIKINELTSSFLEEKLNKCLNNNKNEDKCEEFNSFEFEDFLEFAETEIETFANEKGLSDHKLLAESFFHYLSAKFSETIYTGLVFVGYGEEDIYPSLKSLNISIAVKDHLKYSIKESAEISEHGTAAAIIPFAQVDVTQTIVRGINPNFQNIIYNVIDKSIKSFSDIIAEIIEDRGGGTDVSSAIRGLDCNKIIQNITLQINKEMKESYTDPLLNTVINLDKEDMANMAESFISLTSLVRRMQPGEETVGGPVDVAVISKGDGFVWINRKHYFKPELNTQFFNNYFK